MFGNIFFSALSPTHVRYFMQFGRVNVCVGLSLFGLVNNQEKASQGLSHAVITMHGAHAVRGRLGTRALSCANDAHNMLGHGVMDGMASDSGGSLRPLL
jgi:hypothetical protein